MPSPILICFAYLIISLLGGGVFSNRLSSLSLRSINCCKPAPRNLRITGKWRTRKPQSQYPRSTHCCMSSTLPTSDSHLDCSLRPFFPRILSREFSLLVAVYPLIHLFFFLSITRLYPKILQSFCCFPFQKLPSFTPKAWLFSSQVLK